MASQAKRVRDLRFMVLSSKCYLERPVQDQRLRTVRAGRQRHRYFSLFLSALLSPALKTPACTGLTDRGLLERQRLGDSMFNTTVETHPNGLSTSAVIGDSVVNRAGESLGKIEEIMLDLEKGRVAYAILSFPGMDDTLVAVPCEALSVEAGIGPDVAVEVCPQRRAAAQTGTLLPEVEGGLDVAAFMRVIPLTEEPPGLVHAGIGEAVAIKIAEQPGALPGAEDPGDQMVADERVEHLAGPAPPETVAGIDRAAVREVAVHVPQ